MAIVDMDRDGDGRIWGYALSKRSGVRSGVLYPQLDRMMSEGWLVDHWEDRKADAKRPPRRYYRLTETGRSSLGAMVRRAEREERAAGMTWAPA